MIIFRYLSREILLSMTAVSGVLLLIIMSGRFVAYLAQAAAGRYSHEVLFAMIGYRLPSFLELILPLGMFIAILLAYGRMYMDSEMTVMSACGFSNKRLLVYTMAPGIFVAFIVAMLALVISPLGMQKFESLLDGQQRRSEIDYLTPARFQPMQKGDAVTYVHTISEDHKQLRQVFIAEMAATSARKSRTTNDKPKLAVIVAESGEQIVDSVSGDRYLLLKNGYRYIGRPGELEYQEVKFDTYSQYLQPMNVRNPGDVEADALSTVALWAADELESKAALQWRIALPILVLVVTLLAIPLSHTNPRQGRYAQMIPAILIYIIYLVSLNAVRGLIEDGKVPAAVGMWYVHAIFICIALLLFNKASIWRWVKAYSQRKVKGNGYA